MNIYLNVIENQQIQAQTCALFSRSHTPFATQLKKANDEKSSDFLKKYVANYSHNSINDCGNICVAIERVSMIAAKFIEDFPLFNGQESSSRYISFDVGSFEDNVYCTYNNDDPRKKLQEVAMAFYKKAIPFQKAYIAKQNNLTDQDIQDKVIAGAIKAKTFDVLRGYLPFGCKTQLAMVTTFRQACERIEMMIRYPLQEVRDIGNKLAELCLETYPGAFEGLNKDSHKDSADQYYTDYFWTLYHTPMVNHKDHFCIKVDNPHLFCPSMNRPPSKKFPPIFDIQNSNAIISASIDCGSWRDIHRHRNCQQVFPILEAKEFENFYLDNLAPELRNEAEMLIKNTNTICKLYEDDQYLNQYCIPMGFKVLYKAKWTMSQLLYVLELRSKPTVHHTARQFIEKIHQYINRNFRIIPHMEYSVEDMNNPLKINISRGKQS